MLNNNFLSNIIYKKCNYYRLFLFMLIGICITSVVYSFYSFFSTGYTNLTDFYTGVTLYTNYNKNIDKQLPYIYSFISLLLYFINWEFLSQVFYPFLEKFVNRIVNLKPSKKWIYLAIFIILVLKFRLYNAIIPADNYHYGEILVGNWLLNEHSFKVYSDFFPPHGIIDILPSYIGALFFNDTTVNGVLLGGYILNYAAKFVVTVLAFVTLPFFLACIGAVIILTLPYIYLFASLYLLTIYLFITNKKLKQNFCIYTIALCLISYLYYIITPTYGAPFIITMFIPYIYEFISFFKKSKFLTICLFIISFIFINGMILYIFKDFFINNFCFIFQNFNANLISFGNIGKLNLLNITFRATQYLLIPLFVIMLIEELNTKEKNINNILLLAMLLVFPFIISTYSLGRLDSFIIIRAYIVALSIIVFFIPLVLLNKTRFIKASVYYISFLCIYSLFITVNDVILLGNNLINIPKIASQQTIFRNGNAEFNEKHLEQLESISNVIRSNSTKNSTFLDLTNQGALYFYLNKTPLIPYLAYYNIPSPEQDKICAEILGKNLPDIVLIRGYNIIHDSLPASLRVNNIYRTLLLSNKYIVINNDNITLLKKVDNHIFSQKEIKELEDSLGYSFIQQLPDVYGKSEKKLLMQLQELPIEYTITKQGNKHIINFKTPVYGKKLNYMYISNDNNMRTNIIITINNCDTIIRANKNTQLIPLDIHPSVLLGKVQTIQINPEKDINELKIIKFYQKN